MVVIHLCTFKIFVIKERNEINNMPLLLIIIVSAGAVRW